MEVNKINDFFKKPEIFSEAKKLREKYRKEELNEEETVDFIKSELIPLAKKNNYNLSIEDFMNDTVDVLLDSDLEQVIGGIGMLNKRWISLGLSGISVFSSMPSVIPNVVQRTYAAGDDEEEYCISELTFKETIEKMLNKLNEIKNNENNETKEIEELERFLNTCSEEFDEYIEIINIMLDEFDGIQRATNIKEVKDNLVKSIDILKQGLESENPITRKRATSEKKYIEDVLNNNCLKQENLYNEINHKYQELKDKMNQKDQQLDIDELLTSINGSMRSISGMHSMFKKATSSKKQLIIDEHIIFTDIHNAMVNPNSENLMRLKFIYFNTTREYRFEIYKHVGTLSNRGNPIAFKLLGEFNGIPESECEFEVVKVNDILAGENISVKETATEMFKEIRQENEEINQEFMKFIMDNFKGIGYLDEFPINKTGELSRRHLDCKNQIYRRDLISDYSHLGNYLFWVEVGCPKKSKRVKFGWKLHISAQPSSAKKISEIVLPYLMENNIYFKMCTNLNSLRHINALAQYTQQGKFITIYSENDEQARNLSNYFDKLISEKIADGTLNRGDFCELLGDLKIGLTGAIFARFGNFFGEWITEYRQVPFYPQNGINIKVPFDLKLGFLGAEVKNPDDIIKNDWGGKGLIARNLMEGEYIVTKKK